MKINKFKKNRRIIIGGLITLGVCGWTFMTKSAFKTMSNDNLDKEKMAFYIKSEAGNYEKSSSIPTSGYILNETKSTCSNGAIPSWNLETNNLKLKNLTKGNTSCYLYFDEYCEGKGEACKKILDNKIVGARNKIVGPLVENTTGNMYATEDNDGVSYYFAGAVDNNWVRFAGNYWRIIRVNGDGSIRMLYNGSTTNQTGESTQIGTSAFNEKSDDNAYIGYMYGTPGSSTYEETHANINDSTIKKVLDNWYKDNIANNTSYLDKIDINAGFCNDRGMYNYNNSDYSTLGYSKNPVFYEAFYRLVEKNKSPSFTCNNDDLFTFNNSKKGNKALSNPIGLITADEITFGGGLDGMENENYYLYNGQNYWTMTPSFLRSTYLYTANFHIYENGGLGSDDTTGNIGVRPVINLKADVILVGEGTKDNPFVVQ